MFHIKYLQTHLPGYVEDFDKLKAKGVDEVVWYCCFINLLYKNVILITHFIYVITVSQLTTLL